MGHIFKAIVIYKNMAKRNPTPQDKFRFSSGNFIFRSGSLIDPRSAEGRNIESILKRQRETRELNARQRERFRKITTAKNYKEILHLIQKKPTKSTITPREQMKRMTDKNRWHLGEKTKQVLLQEKAALDNIKPQFRDSLWKKRHVAIKRAIRDLF
jgi:hypothetical protein